MIVLTDMTECAGVPIRYSLRLETAEDGAALYGIAVEYRLETVELPALTTSRRRAEALLKQLRQGQVTPATARDVVEDWMLE